MTAGRLRLVRSLVRAFFPEYLRLVEPDAAERLRLDRLEWLHLPGPALAAEALEAGGGKATLVLRIDRGEPSPDDLSSWLVRGPGRLKVHYGRPVLLHVLSVEQGRPGVNLDTAVAARLAGFEALRIFYTRFGLAGARAEYWLSRPEPLAWALAAWMSPSRLSRAELREACQRRLAAASLPEERRKLLLRFAASGPGGLRESLT